MTPVLMDIQALSKDFGKENVLTNITLQLQEGEIYGLLGPSGSGKTTLIKMMIGLENASEGGITYKGNPLSSKSLFYEVGYMAQGDALYNELTAYENLDFFASLFGMKRSTRKQRIQELMEMVDLSPALYKPVAQYSGGMRRRLSLVIAMLHSPKLLILDEPTVGIDPVLRRKIWNEFQKLKEAGVSLFITTHVMDEAEKCDTLGLIRGGNLIASDSPHQIKEDYHVTTLEDVFLSLEGI
ncbi:ABC transporter ATP-binding protein [Bacillus sp. 2205SS5-2]|uniref:ABC transporter ATP-binding protein n=1 Tax=Bacillus sp. 2205SS5-2 TaxID=3109031 RepID=UPI0030052FCE